MTNVWEQHLAVSKAYEKGIFQGIGIGIFLGLLLAVMIHGFMAYEDRKAACETRGGKWVHEIGCLNKEIFK